jgi:hypothetical protein
VGANFNIPQNVGNETQITKAQVSMITGDEAQVSTIMGNEAQVSMIKGYRETTDGRMDVEAPPIPVATSPLQPTSPASENEVIVWDDRDGPPPPDELTPAPHQAAWKSTSSKQRLPQGTHPQLLKRRLSANLGALAAYPPPQQGDPSHRTNTLDHQATVPALP